jgi:hypothetical protein
MLIQDTNYCTLYLDTAIFYTDPIPQTPYVPYYYNNQIFGYSGNYFHHQFYLDGIAIPGADSSYMTITEPGCYSVFSYSLYPHCGIMSDTICFWVVGDNEIKASNQFHIYPNPVFNELTLSFDKQLTAYDQNIKLTNLLGEHIKIDIINVNAASISINTQDLSAGIYHLSLNGITKKFIKLDD